MVQPEIKGKGSPTKNLSVECIHGHEAPITSLRRNEEQGEQDFPPNPGIGRLQARNARFASKFGSSSPIWLSTALGAQDGSRQSISSNSCPAHASSVIPSTSSNLPEGEFHQWAKLHESHDDDQQYLTVAEAGRKLVLGYNSNLQCFRSHDDSQENNDRTNGLPSPRVFRFDEATQEADSLVSEVTKQTLTPVPRQPYCFEKLSSFTCEGCDALSQSSHRKELWYCTSCEQRLCRSCLLEKHPREDSRSQSHVIAPWEGMSTVERLGEFMIVDQFLK